MRNFKPLSTLFITIAIFHGYASLGQDFSNKGKEFWLCFPQHVPSGNNLATLSIWITSDKASSGTITMTNGTFSANFNIPANGLQEIQVPHSLGHISNTESGMIITKSIKIKVDAGQPPVVAYAQQWGAARSAATLLLPTNVLGKKYYAVSFTQNGSNSSSYLAKSQFQIIATKPNTLVKITPRMNGVVQPSFVVNFPLVGDMYQYQSDQDLTGSLIESTASSSGGGCLPIAVFSGSSNITFGTNTCSGGTASYDPLFQQQYPVSSWGKNFGFIPFGDYPSGNPYRVLASEDNTAVFFNGIQVATLNAGEIYPNTFNSTPVVLMQPTSITADKPIAVAQYAQRLSCSGGNYGDPDMVMLNPIEQNINDITIFSSSQQAINRQWINVLIKTVAVPSFKINGAPPTTAFQNFGSLPGYSYLQQLLTGPGSYRISADSGFNAIAYGLGSNFESYAYSAGTNVKDLYTQLGFLTNYGYSNVPAACIATGSKMKISLPYSADSIRWHINQLPGNPNDTLIKYPPSTFDSTTIVNGKIIYWYSLPTYYIFNTTGTFQVSITTYSPNTDGCGSEQQYDFDVEIVPKPAADFNFITNGCVTNLVQFNDNANPGGRIITTRYWNFNDPASGPANIAGISNPTHSFTAPGNYNVKYSYINDIGCKADTVTKIVTLSNPPVADFTVTGPFCVGKQIAFTDNSSAGVNSWSWNFGDGTPLSTVQNPTHTFFTPGTYTVSLIAGSGGCQSLPDSINITIYSNPVSNFSFPSVVCLPSGATQFTDLSTGSAGNNITTWLWDFNDGSPASSLQNPLHTYTSTGPFNPSLAVTTSNGCTNSKSLLLNTIYPEPQASFNTVPNVCIGSLIGFADASVASGSTVTGWNWNFGDGNTSTLQNPSHVFTAAGNYTVTLQVTSAKGCQTVNNSATQIISVNPLPTASISGNSTVCLNAPSPQVTFTAGSGNAPFTFTYNINGGPVKVITSASGNSVTVNVPTNVAGSFTYNLVNVMEGGSSMCMQQQTGSVTITVKAPPTATVSGNNTVCLNASSPVITFSGASGTAPYTFTYNINGGAIQTVSTTSGNSVTVNVPTAVSGTFNYNLLSVTEGSASRCSQTATGTAAVIIKPLPTATISGSTEVCLNSVSPNVTFTGASGNSPYTFSYNINGGSSQTVTTTNGNTVTVPINTNAAGVYTINLLSVGESSNTTCIQPQTGSAVIKVNPLPTPDFSFSQPACTNGNISFTDASVANAGIINNWQWNFNNPASGATNISSLQNPTHTFSTPGTYNVTLSVSTDKGCVSDVLTRQVQINPKPKAGFIAPVVCTSDPAAPFTDTSKVSNSTIVAWDWNFGDPNANAANPNTSALQNPTHGYTVSGNYTATLIVTGNSGCKDTIQQSFFVNGSVQSADFSVENSTALCSNQEIVLRDASVVQGNITRIEIYWDYMNDPIDKTIINNPVAGSTYRHLYPEFGTPANINYTIRYVAYSGINCLNTVDKQISVLATPTILFNTLPSVCSDAPSFQVTQAQEQNGMPGTGIFSGNGINAAGTFNPSIAGPGTHIIRYTYTNTNGCINYSEQPIVVYQKPAVNAGPDKVVLEGGQVMLTPAQNTGINVTYSWSPSDGLNDPYQAFPVATPLTDITYTLTVTSDKGCSASDDVFVKVLKSIAIPNIFSPNGDGIHDTWVIEFLVSYTGATVDVFNRYGQLIYHSTGYTNPWDGTVNGKPVPVGTYYYIVDPKNGAKPISGYVDIIR